MKYEPNVTFLRYFLSAGQSKSISKAAKENYVSQSAISQAINKLEIALGKQLITHEKNRFQLTVEGVLLLEKSKKIFDVFSEIEDSFNEKDSIYKGVLSFACTHSFALSFLPFHLKKLSQMWPNVEPILRFGHPGTIIESVRKGDVDFGIVLDNDDFSVFQSQELYRGMYRLYHAKDHLTSTSDRFILSEERRETSLLRNHMHAMGVDIKSFIEVSSWEVIANLTEQGLGIGFFPDYIVSKRSLVLASFSLPPIPYRILAIFPKYKQLSRNAKMFIDIMRSEKDSNDP